MKNKIYGFILGWAFLMGLANAQGYVPSSALPTETPEVAVHCVQVAKLYAAYDSKNYNYIKQFAAQHPQDAFYFPTCQLLQYSAKLIPVEAFIQAFPSTRGEYDVFVTASSSCAQTCKIFTEGRGGDPLFVYYTRLFDLMGEGNRLAIQKVMASESWADGEITQYLWSALPDFYAQHAGVILKNWDLFKGRMDLVGELDSWDRTRSNLHHMKEVVLKTQGEKTAKDEFLSEIDKALQAHTKKIKGRMLIYHTGDQSDNAPDIVGDLIHSIEQITVFAKKNNIQLKQDIKFNPADAYTLIDRDRVLNLESVDTGPGLEESCKKFFGIK